MSTLDLNGLKTWILCRALYLYMDSGCCCDQGIRENLLPVLGNLSLFPEPVYKLLKNAL